MESRFHNSAGAILYTPGGTEGSSDSYPMRGVSFPGANDVMLGRGGQTNNHIGNIRFRNLVNEHKRRYLAAPKVDKPKVALEVVKIWRGLDPPGRFLTKTSTEMGDASPWHDVGDKKAREKASQCLRERTPDVLPFVKQLEEQQLLEKDIKRDDDQPVPNKTPIHPSKANPDREATSAALQQPSPKFRRRHKNPTYDAEAIPTGEDLTRVVFSDDGDDVLQAGVEDTHAFMEDYQQVLHDLASAEVADGVPSAAVSSSDARPPLSKAPSGFSWMKSFKSVDSNFSHMDTSAASACTPKDTVDEAGEEEEDELDQTLDSSGTCNPEEKVQAKPVVMSSTRPTLGDVRKPRMVGAAYARDSQMSLMSDLSSRSLMMGNSSDQADRRSLMMGNAADQASKRSVLSVMSDMTELSDALKDMDLSIVGEAPR